MGFEAMLIGN